MHNQQFQTSGTSQYQGLQKQWQPSGTVQSFYGQTQQTQQTQQQYGTYPSSESYHTANYRGNQPGHDASLRGDSFQPSQQQQGWGAQSGFQSAGANYGSFRYGVRGNEQTFGAQNNISQQFGFGNPYGSVRSSISPSYGQTSESFHTANYRGNQPGHDAGLRGDSFQPAQQQSFGQSIESYHTANYRGNQPGHDASLRSDSYQPAQQQISGTGMSMGIQSGFQSGAADYSSFRYGIRGNEQSFGSQNNVSQQFGYNNAY